MNEITYENDRMVSIKNALLVMRGKMEGVLISKKGTAEEQLIQRVPLDDGSTSANLLKNDTDRKSCGPWIGIEESFPLSMFCDKCHILSHLIYGVNYGPEFLCTQCASDRYVELVKKYQEEKYKKDKDLIYWVYMVKEGTFGPINKNGGIVKIKEDAMRWNNRLK